MKRNRYQIFSGSLYVEALKQLRLMGLIYLACCLIFTVLPAWLDSAGGNPYLPSITETAPALFLYMFIAPVTLIYAAFGYLTKRSASDFYHSLPLTRECAYLSRIMAVLTYLVGTIALTLAAAYATYALCGRSVNLGYLPYQFFYFTTSALLMAACALIGLSVTGTYFSAFIVTGVVLFLPRFISFMTIMIIEEVAPIVSSGELGIFLNLSMNLPVATFVQALSLGGYGSDSLDMIMMMPGSMVYTTILAVIYLFLGGLLHHFRKSETAQKNAPNRVLQHIYRCAIALPLFLVVSMLFSLNKASMAEEPLMTSLLIAAALLVYFIYELITTKKLRNLLPALYVLPAVVLVALGISFGGKAVGNTVMHILPEKDEIETVNLGVTGRSGNSNYTELQLSRISYSDEEMQDLLLRGLSNTIKLYDQHASRIQHTPITVRFNLKGGAMTRTIYLPQDDFERLARIQQGYAAYQNAAAKLPDDDEIADFSFGSAIDQKNARLLWETFRQEYNQLTYEQKLSLNANGSYLPAVMETVAAVDDVIVPEEATHSYTATQSMQIFGTTGKQNFYAGYFLTPLTPKALLLHMQMTNQSNAQGGMEALEDGQMLLEGYTEGTVWIYNAFSVYHPADGSSSFMDFSISLDEKAQYDGKTAGIESLDPYMELISLLRQCDTQITDLNSPIVSIDNLSVEVYSNEKETQGCNVNSVYLRLTDVQMDRFLRLTNLLTQQFGSGLG